MPSSSLVAPEPEPLKTRYHALVCASPLSILANGGGSVDATQLINIGDSGRPLGSSQVAAVVSYSPKIGAVAPRPYKIAARATLEPPYFADLANPRKLSRVELRLLYDVGRDGKSVEDWLAVTRQLRRLKFRSKHPLSKPPRYLREIETSAGNPTASPARQIDRSATRPCRTEIRDVERMRRSTMRVAWAATS